VKELDLTYLQVRDSAECLGRLSRLAFFAGLDQAGIVFAQIRLQLLRIEAGIPINEFGWLCLMDLFDDKWTELGAKR
jgi:hypothetical protein